MAGADVKYARSGGVAIAYQVIGDGPRDLIFVCGTMSHLELWWGDPSATAMIERLAGFARVILFDKPGTGLSDPVPATPTVDQRTNDVIAVLDAVGSERAVIVGFSEGGFPALLLAATQPARVEALVLISTMAASEMYPGCPLSQDRLDEVWAIIDGASETWGEGRLLGPMAPSWVGHPVYGRLLGSIERSCMSPGMARSVLQGMHDVDLRAVAEAIHVPTLVMHPAEDLVPQELGRDLAERIPGARFLALEGRDHLFWINNDELVPVSIEEFVTGEHRRPLDRDRVLTTVVFTDIVESTKRLADSGDAQWRATLAEHDRRMDELLVRHDGRPVKHTGDGRMAQFGRPARAVRFATAMVKEAREAGLEIRVGIHTGECEVVGDDLIGLAVNIGARISALAAPGQVLVSSTVHDLIIGSGLAFEAHGQHLLKGAPGMWTLHRAVGDKPGPLLTEGYETDVREQATAAELTRTTRRRDRALVAASHTAPGLSRWAIRTAGRLHRDKGNAPVDPVSPTRS
ncbi:MAG: adenylate/guanylate cyclase domain-containing protein [Acidimicrobiales bacterium]|nr:adenylate/guanylate cyclase domain-containing protein [Acidimicrobiales bacterium]